MSRIAAVVALAWLLAGPLAAAAGEPFVYPSADGTPPASLPQVIAPINGVELDLWIDYQDGFGGASTSGTLCVDANGDETCGFDVLLEMQTDAGVFTGFTPAVAEYVHHIDPATQTTLRVNGLDITGMPIPAPIGTLVVDAASASQLRISVEGMHRVGAASQLDAIQQQVVVELPEPGGLVPLAGGAWLVGALGRRRRRRRPAA